MLEICNSIILILMIENNVFYTVLDRKRTGIFWQSRSLGRQGIPQMEQGEHLRWGPITFLPITLADICSSNLPFIDSLFFIIFFFIKRNPLFPFFPLSSMNQKMHLFLLPQRLWVIKSRKSSTSCWKSWKGSSHSAG